MAQDEEWVIEVPEGIAESLRALLAEATANEIEFLVSLTDGYKFEIFAKEHPPPHFRVKYKGQMNTFRIDNCKPMHGDALSRHFGLIREWHKLNKPRLIQIWNDTRPGNCPVGLYRE